MPSPRKAIVTGGAGFIGSHLCEALVSPKEGYHVVAIDNLRTGNERRLGHLVDSAKLELHKLDLTKGLISPDLLLGTDLLFHLAANPEVRIGKSDTLVDFENNIVATRNLLEALRNAEFRGTMVFASSSTVYGEARVIPTPEDYGPLIPISMYGASKLACESLISAYAKLFGFKAKLIRFANVVGGRSNHGVIYDFLQKLRSNPKKLEVLGDGTQSKSYVHISDCVDGLMASTNLGLDVDVFNLGSAQTTNVLQIARIVAEEMGINEPAIETGYGQGTGGAGWPGDVKNMLLDCQKLSRAGWSIKYSSDEAVRKAANEMVSATSRS
ncbi:MAG: NAD-dependent epimerase/dehydratase family protein [Nitrososphaerota archaeon]|nr:NAD-dependent epimerase/dehydratase family protein [Nitrososphaerota archaeon]